MIRRWILTGIVWFACMTGAIHADDPVQKSQPPDDAGYLPLSRVEKGMRCTGYSSFSGRNLERLEVEIVGIIQNGMPENSIIIGRVDSPSVRRGGIMSGMSGSPVYYESLLIGAVSTAYPYASEPLCGITPIEAMTRLWELEDAPNRMTSRPPRNDLIPAITPENIASFKPIGLAANFSGTPQADRPTLPVFNGIAVLGSNDGTTQDPPPDLKPGSPVGIGLITGDLQLAAFGTLTHVHEDRILAFGHGSFGLGKCNLPLLASSIVSFIPNRVISFKLANAGAPIGALTFDAPSGVTGVLGQTAPTIPVTITVTGLTETPEVYHIRAADHEFLSTNFIAQATAGAIRELGVAWGDMSFSSTLTVHVKDVGTVHRSEMIGSMDNLITAVRGSFDMMEKIHQNPLQDVVIEEVEYRCELAQKSRIMTLDDAAIRNRDYRGGDPLAVQMFFHGDRIEKMQHRVTLTIPRNVPPGDYSLHILDAADYNKLKQIKYPLAHRHPSLRSYFSSLEDHLAGNQLMVILATDAKDFRSENRILPDVPPLLAQVVERPGTRGRLVPSVRFLVARIVTLDNQVFGSHKIPVHIGNATESGP